jgi:hypothetical protein
MTLLSVVVSAVIVSVAMLMMATTFHASSQMSKQSAGYIQATNFIEGVLEEVRLRPYDDVVSMHVTEGLPKLPEALCVVEASPREAGLKEVIVRCSWRSGELRRETKLSTLVAKGGAR